MHEGVDRPFATRRAGSWSRRASPATARERSAGAAHRSHCLSQTRILAVLPIADTAIPRLELEDTLWSASTSPFAVDEPRVSPIFLPTSTQRYVSC